jgi:hypothetical protein
VKTELQNLTEHDIKAWEKDPDNEIKRMEAYQSVVAFAVYLAEEADFIAKRLPDGFIKTHLSEFTASILKAHRELCALEC